MWREIITNIDFSLFLSISLGVFQVHKFPGKNWMYLYLYIHAFLHGSSSFADIALIHSYQGNLMHINFVFRMKNLHVKVHRRRKKKFRRHWGVYILHSCVYCYVNCRCFIKYIVLHPMHLSFCFFVLFFSLFISFHFGFFLLLFFVVSVCVPASMGFCWCSFFNKFTCEGVCEAAGEIDCKDKQVISIIYGI